MKKRNTAAKLTAAALTVCMLAGSTVSAVPTKVMAAETGEDQWEAIQSVISRYYGEWNSANGGGAVSDQLPDTALLGNGDVGVTSELSDAEKTFYISKGDFWNYEGSPLTKHIRREWDQYCPGSHQGRGEQQGYQSGL